jgi:hypothetical protein
MIKGFDQIRAPIKVPASKLLKTNVDKELNWATVLF